MANPFVATKKELDFIGDTISNLKFAASMIGVVFETDPKFLREILPPCFDMPDEPLGDVSIGKWSENFGMRTDCMYVDFPCKYKGVEGTYVLQYYLDHDMPIAIGREAWGEAKKHAKGEIFACGEDIFAYCERNGSRIIEIDAKIPLESKPRKEIGHGFEINGEMDPTGRKLNYEPYVISKQFNITRLVYREGTAKLNFGQTLMDDLAQIPVLNVRYAYYSEHWNHSQIIGLDPLPNGDQYLPFIIGRKYDALVRYPKTACTQHDYD